MTDRFDRDNDGVADCDPAPVFKDSAAKAKKDVADIFEANGEAAAAKAKQDAETQEQLRQEAASSAAIKAAAAANPTSPFQHSTNELKGAAAVTLSKGDPAPHDGDEVPGSDPAFVSRKPVR